MGVGLDLCNDLLVLNVNDVNQTCCDFGLRLLGLLRRGLVCHVLHDELVGEKIPLGLAHTDYIIGGPWLLPCLLRIRSVAVQVHPSAQSLSVEVCQEPSVRCPYLDLALFQCQKFFLLVQEDECLGRVEIRHLLGRVVLAVVYLERVASCLDHDSLVELLQEFDLSSCLVKRDFHQSLACVDVDQRHRNAIGLYDVQQEHNSMANFELSNLVVLQDVLQLIGAQRPYAVCILRAVLGDDFRIELIELYEVRVSETKVFEQLCAFKLLTLEQQIISDLGF